MTLTFQIDKNVISALDEIWNKGGEGYPALVIRKDYGSWLFDVYNYTGEERVVAIDGNGRGFVNPPARFYTKFLKEILLPVADYKGIPIVQTQKGDWIIGCMEPLSDKLKNRIDIADEKLHGYVDTMIKWFEIDCPDSVCSKCTYLKAKHTIEHLERGEFSRRLVNCLYGYKLVDIPEDADIHGRLEYVAHRYFSDLHQSIATSSQDYYDMMESFKWT